MASVHHAGRIRDAVVGEVDTFGGEEAELFARGRGRISLPCVAAG
jgi:hypothetical protein